MFVYYNIFSFFLEISGIAYCFFFVKESQSTHPSIFVPKCLHPLSQTETKQRPWCSMPSSHEVTLPSCINFFQEHHKVLIICYFLSVLYLLDIISAGWTEASPIGWVSSQSNNEWKRYAHNLCPRSSKLCWMDQRITIAFLIVCTILRLWFLRYIQCNALFIVHYILYNSISNLNYH